MIASLREAFPADAKATESADATFAKLEEIAPGVSTLAEDMTIPTRLPAPPRGPCTIPPAYAEGEPLVFVENASDVAIRYISHADALMVAGIEVMTGEIAEGEEPQRAIEILGDFDFGTELEPGESRVERASTGEVYLIEGGGCFVIPAQTTRFVWTGK